MADQMTLWHIRIEPLRAALQPARKGLPLAEYPNMTYEKLPPVTEHVCAPPAALMTKLTLAPAVSVMVAPLPAVKVTLLLVGPTIRARLPTGDTPTAFKAAVDALKLAVMLSPDAVAGLHGLGHTSAWA